ncbi:MAG TPA: hypothetical protein VE783_02510 [Candidatus Limnocylindrales bacterium]|nr:hypothetical protein [Candidatus Limnocylindrales bacterium]
MRLTGFVLGALVTALCIAGCGSSSSSSNTVQLSGIKKRVLISNQQQNALDMFDGNKDALGKTFTATTPGKMVHAGIFTAILSLSPSISFFDQTKEQVSASVQLSDVPTDVVMDSDGGIAWVAERNASVVQVVGSINGNIAVSIPIPSASRLAMGPNFTRLLAFSDDPQHNATNPNGFFVIDEATNVVTPIALAPGDQPIFGLFNGSDNAIFVLNCGTGCGGTAPPSVVRIDLTNLAAPGISAHIPVNGATTAILNGSTLYVAGTAPGAANGTLQAIDTGTLAVSPAVTLLPNGIQGPMAITSNKKLFVGSQGCTVSPIAGTNQVVGCLAILDVSSGTPPASGFPATFPAENAFRQNFDVTGLQPISGRNTVYVIQGGELDFFDQTTNALSSATVIDIVGTAIGVVQIDP